MKHFFTSDFHINHKNILKYEPLRGDLWLTSEDITKRNDIGFEPSYASVEKMNIGIIDNINEIVGEEDVLWVLGDFCFAWKNYIDVVYNFRKKILCQNIFFCIGNHDNEGYENQGKYCAGIEKVFPNIRDTWQVSISLKDGEFCYGNNAFHRAKHCLPKGDKVNLFLSHYPHISWPNSGKGSIMLFGHCHSSLNSWIKNHMSEAKILDVGIDGHNYKPWSLNEILNFMKSKKGQVVDHHGKQEDFKNRLEIQREKISQPIFDGGAELGQD